MCHPGDNSGYNHETEQNVELPGSGRTIPTVAYGYQPGEQRPAVIILHDIYGVNPFYRDMARRLAEQGYAALLPDLFSREGSIPNRDREAAITRVSKSSLATQLEDVQSIVTQLKSEGRKVGVIGFCLGGTLVMHTTSRTSVIDAGVIYYGFPVNNNPIPQRRESPIDEVEQLQAPLIGFFGADDTGVGVYNVLAYKQKALAAHKDIDFTIYPGVGHAFLTFEQEGPTVAASQESWSKALAFLKKHL